VAYIINNTRGQVVAVIPDGTIDSTSTTLQLVGRNVTEYGESENENYVWIMENFAAPTAPPKPLQGQLWYDTANNYMTLRTIGNTWVALADQNYVEAQKESPIFTGIPQAPTAVANVNTNQLATTAFVQAQKISPIFTGVPTAPTAPRGTANSQIATTAFVTDSPLFTGIPESPTAPRATNSDQIATTRFVQDNKVDPIFSGVPRAPTQQRGNSSTALATTAFVTSSPLFTGVPEAPTAASGTGNNQIATTAFVTNSVQLQGVPTAPTAASGTGNNQIATTAFVTNSVQLQGVPTAPTAANITNTNQIATTAFVQEQKANIVLTGIPLVPTPDGTVLNQITDVFFVNQQISSIDLSVKADINSPLFTGIPRAPTASQTTINTQIATCEFVARAIGAIPGPDVSNALWQGSQKFVSIQDPDPNLGRNGDFWFRYQM
jgi:hypothetical protein